MPTLLRLPDSIADLAIPAVMFLIFFLSYTSQVLFYYIKPGPLSLKEAVWLNGCVLAIWWCYDRACNVDPGPVGWVKRVVVVEEESEKEGGEKTDGEKEMKVPKGMRWCRKCDAVKPPRSHHCKRCGRCIPKMDHHCPWTSNCVSHTTFPHFLRFVFYALVSMSILAYHLYTRSLIIWSERSLPAYLGPSIWALSHLLVLLCLNSFVLFALSILFIHAAHGLATNTTMIENWEIERHEALVRRARKSSGYVYTNGGQRMRIEQQEFPYDIGVWKNLCQGMGTWNMIMWFMPFGGGPSINTAAEWEINDFEDADKSWPPPDPDKMPWNYRPIEPQANILIHGTPDEEIVAFRRRQQQDYAFKRKQYKVETDQPRVLVGYDNVTDHTESQWFDGVDSDTPSSSGGSENGQGRTESQAWTNSEGERLTDFGVDEDAEFDDDDVPLAELLRRRRARPFE